MNRILLFLSVALPAWAMEYHVATNGNDSAAGSLTAPWRTIQKAANTATPGATVYVWPGTYNEKITINVTGPLALIGTNGPVVSGAGRPGQNLIYIANKSGITIEGFVLRDNTGVTDGSGIRFEGAGSNLTFRANRIHNIRGSNAMGITVYATSGTQPVTNLVIAGNEVFDCDAAPSEAITLNGNVTGFRIESNYVHDVNNIGIDMIGGEGMAPANDVTRHGVCRGNRVERARSSYGGGYAAGIYVDGGRDIIVENNVVTECDLGIEVGCENRGLIASNVIVRSNLIYSNDKAGLVFGGYASNVGRVNNCQFLFNTLVGNDTLGTGNGELWMQHASNNVVAGNIIVSTAQNLLLSSISGSRSNRLDYNLWYCPGGSNTARFVWRGTTYTGFNAYRTGSQQDAHSQFANPLLTNFHLRVLSPAVDAGPPDYWPAAGETDLDGQPRRTGPRPDCGADELSAFDAWRVEQFSPAQLANESHSGATADPDADGVVNLLEYAFRTEPLASNDTSRLPVVGLTIPSTTRYLTLTYRQNKAATDLVFEPQAAGALTNGAWSSTGVVEIGREDAGDWWRVTARDSVPVNAAQQRFMRLRVRNP
ncbi:MAG: right-handed parallel beta-helix repeat-containing protein [Verrucomicrobiae bacterium]|nr:right-handed parallel beta-helix repeat-containing protein [Verrucomicrobiae bacterium]